MNRQLQTAKALPVFIFVLVLLMILPASAAKWQFVLLWQQPIDGGVAALATGNLSGDNAPEIAVATWQNDIRVLSCSGERDTTFSAPPTEGNVTLLSIGQGEKANYVVAGTLWQPSIAAYAADGRRLWVYEDLKNAGVTGITTIRAKTGDMVAASYSGKPGIRLIDEHGGVVATTAKLSHAFFVCGLDCDGDGTEEMLAAPEKQSDPKKPELTYYDAECKLKKSVPFPGITSLAVSADVDNDGKEDIVSYYGSEVIYVGAWSRSGKDIWKVKSPKASAPSSLVAADLDGDKKREIIAAFPMGQIIVLKNGQQIAAVQAQQKFPRVAAADVDSDGKSELLVGDGLGLRAFKIEPKTAAK